MKLSILVTLVLVFAHSGNAQAFWNGKSPDNQERIYEKTPRDQLSLLEWVPADILHLIAWRLDHPSDLDALDATSQTLHDHLTQTQGKSFNKRILRSKLIPLIGQSKETTGTYSMNGMVYSIDTLSLELQSKLQWKFSWLRRIDLEREYTGHFPGVMEVRGSHASGKAARMVLFFAAKGDGTGLQLPLEEAGLYCQQKADFLKIPVHQASSDELKWLGLSFSGVEITEYGKGEQGQMNFSANAAGKAADADTSKEETKNLIPVICVYSVQCQSDDLCTIL